MAYKLLTDMNSEAQLCMFPVQHDTETMMSRMLKLGDMRCTKTESEQVPVEGIQCHAHVGQICMVHSKFQEASATCCISKWYNSTWSAEAAY